MKVAISVMLGLVFAGSVAADEAQDEADVWALEEAYWVYVKEQELDRYRDLWDDRFVGWPGFSATPQDKEKIADWIPGMHADPTRIYNYELQREAVRSFGDSVVAHYLVVDIYTDAQSGDVVERGDPYRVTHTWQRRGDTWQIITGMSASWAGEE